MASETINVWSYSGTQKDFVKYFDRLREVEMSFDEIESKLPQLEKYYQEMVNDKLDDFHLKDTVYDFFQKWKKNR